MLQHDRPLRSEQAVPIRLRDSEVGEFTGVQGSNPSCAITQVLFRRELDMSNSPASPCLNPLFSREYVNERPNHFIRSRGLFGLTATLSYRGLCLSGALPLILSPQRVGVELRWPRSHAVPRQVVRSWISFVWESLPAWFPLLTCNASIPTSRDTAPRRNIPAHPTPEDIPMNWDPLPVQMLMTSEIWFIQMVKKWMQTWTMILTLP